MKKILFAAAAVLLAALFYGAFGIVCPSDFSRGAFSEDRYSGRYFKRNLSTERVYGLVGHNRGLDSLIAAAAFFAAFCGISALFREGGGGER